MIWIFDIETILDAELIRKTMNLEGTDVEVMNLAKDIYQGKKGNRFLPLPYHKIVNISILGLDKDKNFLKLSSINDEDEKEIIEKFLDALNKNNPQVITFNGRSFDLPVLMIRAMKYSLSCNTYFENENSKIGKNRWSNYRARYNEKFHLDLMDSLSEFGAVRGLSLDLLSSMIGAPGKYEVNGSQVIDLYYNGELEKIKEYCESDVLNTYWLYLKYEVLRGNITREEFGKKLEILKENLIKNRYYFEIFEENINKELDNLNGVEKGIEEENKKENKGEKMILLTGANGQLGTDFKKLFDEKQLKYIATDYKELDITNIDNVREFVKNKNIKYIINCAAYNNVDKAEEERDKVYALNCDAPKNLAIIAKEIDAIFVTYSTDFVFDGEKGEAYVEKDKVSPVSVYGQSKADGEKKVLEAYEKVFVIRTSWVFGTGNSNFNTQVINWSKSRTELSIVDDQISVPTYSWDLAEFSWKLIETNEFGLYHISNDGIASKYDQAKYLLDKIGWKGELKKAKTSDFNLAAKRAKFSKLSSEKVEKLVGEKLPNWKSGIDRYLGMA
ncbi:dTDP-4-dehydrorhamnose reductase [Haliovirga abyssi]|uniref:dTDP-4-dehydrorhamnose reductase n=1 Tax=Haliovirga abyssi TaxID=2996794 RepID=A0AAU9D181_9FUSO|nr:dTDP-4-dehydrorhamnose reductase [Haliovirga abyssi]BDU49729.1 hypothetical protein HLVA_02980 [Haliovirga abyssi]